MVERKLDWKPNYDPRRAAHKVSLLATPRRSRYWKAGPILDQGDDGACVGFAVTGAVNSHPISLRLPHPQQTAVGMYYGSKRIDEWRGESYDGTSVDAGMKLARELGFISSWEWCPTPDHLRYTVLEEGPVVCGLWVEEGFWTPDEEGIVDITGGEMGGHCMYICGYSTNRQFTRYTGPVYQLANSWGSEWGRRGYLYLREADLAAKFDQDGEFAIPRR